MSFQDYLKLERYPPSWCGGCGIGLIVKTVAQAFDELELQKNRTTVVSGIGCTGRSAGYFNLDTVHGLHGRAVPMAEGIKRTRPEMNVIVLSGDGDLLGIGGNHLIHTARRNTKLTVICCNNYTYGMTGGQKSPTTKKGIKTVTSPYGNEDTPINVQNIIRAHQNFYARSTTYHLPHLKSCIKEALQHDGFAFVDIISNCVENYGRRVGFKNAFAMLTEFKNFYRIAKDKEKLEDNEIGIIK